MHGLKTCTKSDAEASVPISRRPYPYGTAVDNVILLVAHQTSKHPVVDRSN